MPTVTRITPQRRAANRRNVYLDGAFASGCNLNVVARFRLTDGMVLTPEQVEQIQQGEVRQECFDAAIRSLESRLHGRAELKRKLMLKEFGEPVIDGVLDDLQRMAYLDDARFARAKAESAAKVKHHGKRRAMAELARRGIGRDVAEAALGAVYTKASSLAVATQLAEKQAPRLRRLDPAVAPPPLGRHAPAAGGSSTTPSSRSSTVCSVRPATTIRRWVHASKRVLTALSQGSQKRPEPQMHTDGHGSELGRFLARSVSIRVHLWSHIFVSLEP